MNPIHMRWGNLGLQWVGIHSIGFVGVQLWDAFVFFAFLVILSLFISKSPPNNLPDCSESAGPITPCKNIRFSLVESQVSCFDFGDLVPGSRLGKRLGGVFTCGEHQVNFLSSPVFSRSASGGRGTRFPCVRGINSFVLRNTTIGLLADRNAGLNDSPYQKENRIECWEIVLFELKRIRLIW